MIGQRNEVDTFDTTDFGAKAPMGLTIVALTALHFVCCGLPLLLLSGVSLATLVPSWPVMGGVLAVLSVVGLIRYLGKGCATCPENQKWGDRGACSRDQLGGGRAPGVSEDRATTNEAFGRIADDDLARRLLPSGQDTGSPRLTTESKKTTSRWVLPAVEGKPRSMALP